MSIREHLSKEEIQWADQVVEKMHHKLTAVRERSATKLPAETNNGVHDDKLTAKGNIGIAKGVSVKFHSVFTKQGFKAEICHTEERTNPQLRRFVLSA